MNLKIFATYDLIVNIFMENKDEIDDLLEEINSLPDSLNNNYVPNYSNTSSLAKSITSTDQLNDFIVEKGVELIETGLNAIRDVERSSSSAKTPEEIEAYSELIKSVSGAIDALNKINIQTLRNRGAKEVKQLEVDAKLQTAKQITASPNQTNVLIATRDDFFKKILDTVQDSNPVIDV
jgi:hypothetical protein